MSLTPDTLEAFCLSLPAATLAVQWGDDRVFKVGTRMFAILDEDRHLSFKCSEIAYHMLTQRAGIRPAPYLARAHWVQLEDLGTLEEEDLLDYLRLAYGLVVQKLPKPERQRITALLGGPAVRLH